MGGLNHFSKCLILILGLVGTTACSNSVPLVESLMSPSTPAAPKDPNNFVQLSAASTKESVGNGYKGVLRVSQPTGQLKAVSSGGYKLNGTVTLQR